MSKQLRGKQSTSEGSTVMTRQIGTLILLGCLWVPGAAQAQSYPTKTITMVVTAAAGGVTDVVARAIGQRLSEKWGQQVVIENRGGGGHILGAQAVAKAAPDGHTLMVAEAGTYVINPTVYPKEKLNYDLEKDLIQITGLVRIHHALVTNPSVPAKTLGELIALAKSKPGTLTYGTAGLGSGPHLNMVRLEHTTGAKFLTVHYRGATPALTDVIGGHTNMMMISVGSALGAYESGKIRMLAIGSPKRLPSLPDIPTAEESVPGYTAGTWFGLSVTAGTPRDAVMKINSEVRQIIAEPAIQEQFVKKQLYEPMTSSPEEFAQFIKTETERWGKVIREQKLEIAH
jgi:tripartite-type tricarboxylate transporter receptor subunit TctC